MEQNEIQRLYFMYPEIVMGFFKTLFAASNDSFSAVHELNQVLIKFNREKAEEKEKAKMGLEEKTKLEELEKIWFGEKI